MLVEPSKPSSGWDSPADRRKPFRTWFDGNKMSYVFIEYSLILSLTFSLSDGSLPLDIIEKFIWNFVNEIIWKNNFYFYQQHTVTNRQTGYRHTGY